MGIVCRFLKKFTEFFGIINIFQAGKPPRIERSFGLESEKIVKKIKEYLRERGDSMDELTTRQKILKELEASKTKYMGMVNQLRDCGYVLPEERTIIITRIKNDMAMVAEAIKNAKSNKE